MAELDLGSGSGTDTLGGLVTYLDNGGSAARILTSSILGLVVSPFLAFANIVDAIGTFFSVPFTSTAEAISALLSGIFEAPGQLLTAGAEITEATLRTYLADSLAGLLAFPIVVGIVLIALYFIARYLREDETGDTLPGLPVDVPTEVLGVEEERGVDE